MSNLVEHAKRELELAGFYQDDEDRLNKMLRDNVIELIEVFSKQGHSGMSAPIVSRIFYKLANYQTLQPITGEDDEWNDIGQEMGINIYQNKRCSALFKKGKDGRAYYLDAIMWHDVETDTTFTRNVTLRYDNRIIEIGSTHYVRFPFTPKTFIVDIIKMEDGIYISVDSQKLDDVFDYYDLKA